MRSTSPYTTGNPRSLFDNINVTSTYRLLLSNNEMELLMGAPNIKQ